VAEQETSTTHRRDETGSLAIPVIWGVAAGLFAAVITRGVLPGGIVVVVALMVFAAVVLSSRRGRSSPRRHKGRAAHEATRTPARRQGPPRPPAAMTRAAIATGSPALAAGDLAGQALPPPEAAPQSEAGQTPPARSGWLEQAQRFAFGERSAKPDHDASVRED
jgi:hypothetical protein